MNEQKILSSIIDINTRLNYVRFLPIGDNTEAEQDICNYPELARILQQWKEAGFSVYFNNEMATPEKTNRVAKMLVSIPVVEATEMTQSYFQFACHTMAQIDGGDELLIGFHADYLFAPKLLLCICGSNFGFAFRL